MDKKNNNIIASIHVDLIGNENDKEQGMAVRIEGNPLTLGAVYMELTKALLSNGIPKTFIQAAYESAIEKSCSDKSEVDDIEDTLAAFARLFK
jgi:hypothetical protein